MRSIKHEDGLGTAVAAANPSRSTNLKRRGFLLTLGVGGAGAAAVAVRSLSAGAVATDAVSVADDGGYAATAHVQTYYKTAKV